MTITTSPKQLRVDFAGPFTRRLAAASLALLTLGCDAPEDGIPMEERFAELSERGEPLAFGGCVPGIVTVCEDPVSGTSPQANVDGGTFLPAGFRIDEKGNHITFDFGEDLVAGTVRFTLTGIGPESLDQDTLLLLLATDTPELKNPAPTRGLELKIWGSAVDPTAAGNTRFGAGDTMQEAVKSAGILEYDPAETYEFEIAWDDAEQTLFMARDGEVLLDFETGDLIPGPDNDPITMRYRYIHLAMPYLGNPQFWPIIDGVYGAVAIGATPASGGPPPGEGTTTDDGGDPVTGTAGSEESSEGEGSSEAGAPETSGGSGDASGTSDDGASDDGADTFAVPGTDDSTADVGCACTSATSSRGPASAFTVWLAVLLLGLRGAPSGRRRARGA
jgi:hypothetical protein